jgi:hypothetical protein
LVVDALNRSTDDAQNPVERNGGAHLVLTEQGRAVLSALLSE